MIRFQDVVKRRKRARSDEHNEIYFIKMTTRGARKKSRLWLAQKGLPAETALLSSEQLKRLRNVENFENFPFASLLVADRFSQKNV